MAVKLYVMKRDLGLSPGLTAPLLEFLSGDCSVFLFPPRTLWWCTRRLLVQRPWSPANRQASTRAVKPNSANGGC